MGLLRFILALIVILGHSNFFGIDFIGGLFAVKIFFIISGFYMAMILNEKYIGKGSYKIFIENRILRLYPIYLTILFLGIIISLLGGYFMNNYGYFNNYITYNSVLSITDIIILFFSNLFIIGQDIIRLFSFDISNGKLLFFGNYSSTLISTTVFLFLPHAWTLSMELFFYFIAPFIVRRSNITIITLIVILLIIRIILSYLYNNLDFTYFLPYQLVFFLFGVISYKIYKYLIEKDLLYIKYSYIIIIIFSLLILFYDAISWVKYINYFIYLMTILVIPFLFLKTKSIKFDKIIGELSYPIYVVHLLIIYILVALNKTFLGMPDFLITLLSIIISIIFSIILVKYIEKPINSYRQRLVIKNISFKK